MKYSVQYIDRLLGGDTYHDLVELSSVIRSSQHYTSQAVDYGLPTFAFVFAETLLWFAQAIRSGAWTYYEATPLLRQTAMAESLQVLAPPGFAEWYERGMSSWQDEEEMEAVGEWIKTNDYVAQNWLRGLARENRESILAMS